MAPDVAGTEPGDINASGAVSGQYFDSLGVYHGFLRQANGRITTFDIPGACTDSGAGTFPFTLNSSDTITGNFCDASTCHGFIWK